MVNLLTLLTVSYFEVALNSATVYLSWKIIKGLITTCHIEEQYFPAD